MRTYRQRHMRHVALFCMVFLGWLVSCGVPEPTTQRNETPTPEAVSSMMPAETSSASFQNETTIPTITRQPSPTVDRVLVVTPAATSLFDERDLGEIAYYEKELQRSDLDPAIRAGYEDQIATIKYWMRQRAEARNSGVTPNEALTPLVSDPTSTPFPRGILPAREELTTPQYIEASFTAENGWTDGKTIAVYAGAARYEANKGAIVILQKQADSSIKEEWYFTPRESAHAEYPKAC